jgi:Tol biopolymer transport system component
MECLEGESLAERLKRGPLALPELLKIGRDIADALDRAHRAGIVHRDLKPANVVLTKSGAKLLDFGLAKPAGMNAVAAHGSSNRAPLLSAAMTMTSPNPQQSPLTEHGTLLGTIQYMSPEQIKGMEADPRSDIFALGATLYEMATAKRAFEGKSQISIASAILEKDPEPISSIEKSCPRGLDKVISTCLAKDPEDRYASAHDIKIELIWLASEPRKTQSEAQSGKLSRRTVSLLIAAGLLLVGMTALAANWAARGNSMPLIQAVIPTPENVSLDATGDFGGAAVISPDGQAIAFSAHASGNPRALWVRRLAEGAPQRLAGTDDASFPFWSPDSRSIAFFARGKLYKINANGGPVLALADAPSARGGAWGKNDDILYEQDFQSPLTRVSAQGGTISAATVLDSGRHTTHRWPWFLPDGRHFLFLATNHNGGIQEQNGVYFGSLDNKETHLVVASDSGAQFANGYLLFHSQNALMAQPFDPSSGKLSGDATVLIDRVALDLGVWRTIFSVSNTGILEYQAGTFSTGSELVMVDRTGKELGHIGEREHYSTMRVSPDGKRLATAMGDQKLNLWVMDLTRKGAATRLTFEQGSVDNASWSADGSEIYYNVFPGTAAGNTPISSSSAEIYVKRANGSGGSKLLVQEKALIPGNRLRPAAMLPALDTSGKNLIYIRREGPVGNTIVSIPASGTGDTTTLVTPGSPQGNIVDFRLSPDGRWLAYTSTESGRSDVYLVSYPNSGSGRWQISGNGGQAVAWRGDGKELFYFGIDNHVYAVPFRTDGAQPDIGAPQQLFSIPNTAFNGFYEVMPDGKSFLVNRVPEQVSSPVSILLNWTEALKKK